MGPPNFHEIWMSEFGGHQGVTPFGAFFPKIKSDIFHPI